MEVTYIVFDLEATCEDRSIFPHFDNETIEIGAVKIKNGKIVDEFQSFVRPSKNQVLTDFCKELTHICQSNVDNAPSFKEALSDFKGWAGDAQLLSWGFYDRKQLEKDSKRYGMDIRWLENHRSIKHEHQQIKRLKRPVGVQKALGIEGMTFEGTHHRGIDDARNIARIYLTVFVQNSFVIFDKNKAPIGIIDDYDKAMQFIYDHDDDEYTWKRFVVNALLNK